MTPDAHREPATVATGRRMRRARVTAATFALATFAPVMAWVGCGGTTGHHESARPAASGATDYGDATVPEADADEGLFDVLVPYADRLIPDVQPPVDAGAIDWPNCPRDIGIGADGKVIDIDQSAYVVAADYDDAGAVVPAADASACARHVWLGRREWDACIRQQTSSQAALPPCNAVTEAGAARRGPRTGESLFRLCQELVACTVRTGCGLSDATECLCGLGTNGSYPECKRRGLVGPCAQEELAALQIDPQDPGALDTALSHYVETASPLYAAASQLNQLYAIGKSNGCFPAADAGAD